MAAFLSGTVVGGIMGIVILCLCQAAFRADRDMPKL
ncbi:DUF3789 domain-containing protein [Neglectibacter timonensis]|nr:hypothetical protein BN3662_01381 [Clostridiales bacterium CHKCI006]